jgi:threonine/homoserine/homoserine lactone efflux protein
VPSARRQYRGEVPDTSTLIAFSIAALVLFVVPGPAVLYVVTRSLVGGRRAGVVSVAGIHLGSLVHIAAAVAGLSALLATSAVAFQSVKLLGAAYLIYLGARAILDRHKVGPVTDEVRPAGPARIFWQGFLVNLLNPKTAIFFLAFVPQFIDPSANTTTQLLVLGAFFVALGFISDGLYATVFGTFGHRLTGRRGWQTAQWAIPGTVYVGLGAFAALSGGDLEG